MLERQRYCLLHPGCGSKRGFFGCVRTHANLEEASPVGIFYTTLYLALERLSIPGPIQGLQPRAIDTSLIPVTRDRTPLATASA